MENKENNSGAVDLAFQMGLVLLENGAEIFRVQETVERVAKAYGVDDMGVYVLSNALFASGADSENPRKTLLKYVRSSSIHFGIISAVNQLSREIEQGKYTVAEAVSALKEIKSIPKTRAWLLVAACGIGSASFCYIFGGSYIDSLSALIIGLFVQLFLNCAEKTKWSKILTNMLASSVAAILALGLMRFGLGENLEAILSGAIIRLVPGVALTVSIRDFFNSDYLSGTIRMIDALLVGGSIVIGVGVVLKLASTFALL